MIVSELLDFGSFHVFEPVTRRKIVDSSINCLLRLQDGGDLIIQRIYEKKMVLSLWPLNISLTALFLDNFSLDGNFYEKFIIRTFEFQ